MTKWWVMQSQSKVRHAFERYVSAREYIVANGYESELDWQASRDIETVTETEYLREAAWVILNSGMRESVVRRKFPTIEKAFSDFESAIQIVDSWEDCVRAAEREFNHPQKLRAIVSIAFRIALDGFENVRSATEKYGAAFLASFDFIGPITSKHLAKNLGISEAKSDRHLVRIADVLEFDSVSDLCSTLSELTGDTVPVVDVVMWRFATLKSDYREWFEKGEGLEAWSCDRWYSLHSDEHGARPVGQ